MIQNKQSLLLLIVSLALIEWYWMILVASTFVEVSFFLLVTAFFLLGECYVSMDKENDLRFYNNIRVVAVLLLIICIMLM